ncbi:glycosyltransferase family 39 protein [Candidatus Daviesbacteria bacterium]|nr:glycosyltransferase family 39 protein [Candidatus Daviesbacteria bacterium]
MLKHPKLSYLQIVFLILLISLFLRFYNLPNSFVFAGDEEYQAILAQSIVKDFHIIWVGVNAAHTGFYLGPYWAYFTAFWLAIAKGDPLITGYISSAIGVLTTLLIILTGATLFSKKAGLMAGLLYATLPLMVFFDQKYWNPTPIPFLSLLMLISLSQLKKNPNWAILFAAGYGLVFHTHLSLIPIIFVAIFWIVKEKIKLPQKTVLLSLTAFLLMIAPLIAFDYFHKGSNLTTPLRFAEITSDYRNNINPLHHFRAFFQTMGRIYYLAPFGNNSDEVITSCTNASRINNPPVDGISKRFTPPVWLSFLGLGILIIFLLQRKTWQSANTRLLSLFLLSIIIFFLLFPGGAFEYYLLGIFPLLLFIPGILATYFPKLKILITGAVLILSILGVYSIITNNPQFGYGAKKSLIKQTANIIGNQPFELKQTGLCHFYEGWRYLFVLNGKKPERSESDEGLGWLYPEEITQNPVKLEIILSEERAGVNFATSGARVLKSGGFSAYIFEKNL